MKSYDDKRDLIIYAKIITIENDMKLWAMTNRKIGDWLLTRMVCKNQLFIRLVFFLLKVELNYMMVLPRSINCGIKTSLFICGNALYTSGNVSNQTFIAYKQPV